MKLGRAIATSLALLASACAPTSDVDADQSQDTTTVPVAQTMTSPTSGTAESPDPRTVEVIYRCGSAEFTLTELAGLTDLPNPSSQLFDEMTSWNYLGTADHWAVATSGYAIDTTPLDTSPKAFVYTQMNEGSDPNSCVPVTSVDYNYAIRWRAQSVTGSFAVLAIGNCVDPAEAIADVRVVNGDLVVWVYGWDGGDEACEIDGSNTIGVELPGGVIGLLLSGHTWPPVEADPTTWYSPGKLSVVKATAEDLARITCEAISELHGVSVTYYNVPFGLGGDILADGATESGFLSEDHGAVGEADVLFGRRMIEYGNPADRWDIPADVLEEVREPKGTVSLFGAGQMRHYEIRLSFDGVTQLVDCGEAGTLTELPIPECSLTLVGGFPSLVFADPHNVYSPGTATFIRDGEPIVIPISFGGPIDTTAVPGMIYSYQVELADGLGDRPTVSADCGSIAVTGPSSQSEELESAKILFDRIGAGPHIYLTVRTGDTEQELFMTWSRSQTHEFVPADPAAEVFNPFTIHDRLAAALEAGNPVTYELNAASGLPVSWTIDGVERGFVCLQFDTSLPESRDPACQPEYNMVR